MYFLIFRAIFWSCGVFPVPWLHFTYLIGSVTSRLRSCIQKINIHLHNIKPVTFPSWASLMACPVDVVLRRLFPPNVLRPLIRLARPPAPWAGPPGTGPPATPGVPGPTVRPSSSVTKNVDHILRKYKTTKEAEQGPVCGLTRFGLFFNSRLRVEQKQRKWLVRNWKKNY